MVRQVEWLVAAEAMGCQATEQQVAKLVVQVVQVAGRVRWVRQLGRPLVRQ